eukprot:COSAG05_NODE_614_length_8342_cov_5.716851_2_plen_470_part_00
MPNTLTMTMCSAVTSLLLIGSAWAQSGPPPPSPVAAILEDAPAAPSAWNNDNLHQQRRRRELAEFWNRGDSTCLQYRSYYYSSCPRGSHCHHYECHLELDKCTTTCACDGTKLWLGTNANSPTKDSVCVDAHIRSYLGQQLVYYCPALARLHTDARGSMCVCVSNAHRTGLECSCNAGYSKSRSGKKCEQACSSGMYRNAAGFCVCSNPNMHPGASGSCVCDSGYYMHGDGTCKSWRDCEGHYAGCTMKCESAAQRKWVVTVTPGGTGLTCPAAQAKQQRLSCRPGDGHCFTRNATCNGHGDPSRDGSCACDKDYFHKDCSLKYTRAEHCSGNGEPKFDGHLRCMCDPGFVTSDCSETCVDESQPYAGLCSCSKRSDGTTGTHNDCPLGAPEQVAFLACALALFAGLHCYAKSKKQTSRRVGVFVPVAPVAVTPATQPSDVLQTLDQTLSGSNTPSPDVVQTHNPASMV